VALVNIFGGAQSWADTALIPSYCSIDSPLVQHACSSVGFHTLYRAYDETSDSNKYARNLTSNLVTTVLN